MTQAKPRCIITGCDLIAPDANQVAHGDLWEHGDVYIFNAVLSGGETLWQDNTRQSAWGDKALILNKFTDRYFERRGVIVVHKSVGRLTDAAQEYTNAAR